MVGDSRLHGHWPGGYSEVERAYEACGFNWDVFLRKSPEKRGKSRLFKQYDKLFPAGEFGTYYEPFVGSGAVFFHLRQRGIADRYVLSDINRELINIYRVVRDCVEPLIEKLAAHEENHKKRYYYKVRRQDRNGHWPGGYSEVERAARMIYLNKTCFNGYVE